MTKLLSGKTVFRIPFDSEENARILYQALSPETVSVPSDRATVEVTVQEASLIVKIDATDLTALRAAANSYLSWMAACQRTLDTCQNP